MYSLRIHFQLSCVSAVKAAVSWLFAIYAHSVILSSRSAEMGSMTRLEPSSLMVTSPSFARGASCWLVSGYRLQGFVGRFEGFFWLAE